MSTENNATVKINIIRETEGATRKALEFRKSNGKYYVHHDLDSGGSSYATDEYETLADAVEGFEK